MLLYALLHLTGYDLPIDELKRFRQLHSKTPGHPEVGVTPGVETTTGPLGQGLGNAVGMALAERLLAARVQPRRLSRWSTTTPRCSLGDGCLMEGISHEVCSLAGTLRPGKLIVLYDDNGISIDGEVQGWFTDDTPARFEAYGWHVIARRRRPRRRGGRPRDRDGRAGPNGATRADADLVPHRHRQGRARTRGTATAHGAPLGDEGIAATRDGARLARTPPFEIPGRRLRAPGTRARARRAARGRLARAVRSLPRALPGAGRRVRAPHARRAAGRLADDIVDRVRRGAGRARARPSPPARPRRTRSRPRPGAAGAARRLGRPHRLNLTDWKGCARASRAHGLARPLHQLRRARVRHGRDHERHRAARRLHSLRRHLPHLHRLRAQRAAHGGADEAARDLRLHARLDRPRRGRPDAPAGRARREPAADPAAWTSGARATPVETAVAWAAAIERADGPTVAAAHAPERAVRQPRDARAGRGDPPRRLRARDCADGAPQASIIATGSEVGLALAARELLAAEGIAVRVVSMPSTSVFDAQDVAYGASVLPAGCRASRSRPASPTAGGSTSAARRASSASTASASRRRPACCSSSSASPPANVADTVRAVLQRRPRR